METMGNLPNMKQTNIQEQIREELKVKQQIDVEAEIRARIDFLKAYLLHTGARGFVLGLSGGQDSTLTGKLAQLAVAETRNSCFPPLAIRGLGTTTLQIL